MLPTMCLKFVLFLIVLEARALYGERSECNLSATQNLVNICDNPDYLVHISESVCGEERTPDCLCILVDNRYSEYSGKEIKIEMNDSFDVAWAQLLRTYHYNNSHIASFKIRSELNRIYIRPLNSTSPVPKLLSVKIEGHEICNFQSRLLTEPFEGEFNINPINNNIELEPKIIETRQTHEIQDDPLRFLNDCAHRRRYTTNSKRYCPNDDRTNFIFENRYLWHGEWYWCIIVTNENNLFSSTNQLKISYTPNQKFLAYMPSNALVAQNNTESVFQLGNQQTIVAISVDDSRIDPVHLNEITINGYPVCKITGETGLEFVPPPSQPFSELPQQPSVSQESAPVLQLSSQPQQSQVYQELPSYQESPVVQQAQTTQLTQLPQLLPVVSRISEIASVPDGPPIKILPQPGTNYRYEYKNQWTVQGKYTIPPSIAGEPVEPKYEIYTDIKKFSNFQQQPN